jgi:hypothetical protein
MPVRLVLALMVVAHSLLYDGHILAAISHLHAYASVSPEDDNSGIESLLRIMREPIPVLLKEERPMQRGGEAIASRAEFQQALADARSARWRRAAAAFEKLTQEDNVDPAVWMNLALCRARVAEDEQAAEALHTYARQSVPEDDAIEAEALAELLSSESGEGQVETVKLTYSVRDVAALEAALDGHGRFDRRPMDPSMVEGDQPPPRAVYLLLDRELDAQATDLELDEVPRIAGQMALFGKQTDKPAQLELAIDRPGQLDKARSLIEQVAADAIEGAPAEEILGSSSKLKWAILSLPLRFPDQMPPPRCHQLQLQDQRERVLVQWPKLPLPQFDGKSPAEVAGDAAYRVRVQAAVLVLEMTYAAGWLHIDMNELRQALGLPIPAPIAPADVDLMQLSMIRVPRVVLADLAEDDLIQLYRRAAMMTHARAIAPLAEELIRREGLHEEIDLASIYGTLAQLETDWQRASEHVDRGRRAAEAAGQSPARFYLMDLSMSIERGDSNRFNTAIDALKRKHFGEPGVAQAVLQILSSYGLIGPDGQPAQAPQPVSRLVVPGGADQPGEIWTPGGESPASEKSALWMPGMD